MNTKNITKPFKAGFMQNPQKSKNITESIEAKPFSSFLKLHNQSYLQTPYYKTISLTKTCFFNGPFTKRLVAKTRKTPSLSTLNGGN
jgi:hypothetical protein